MGDAERAVPARKVRHGYSEPPDVRELIAMALAAFSIGSAGPALAHALAERPGSTVTPATDVASCDHDGVTTSQQTEWSSEKRRFVVSSVTVSGVDRKCHGRRVHVTLFDKGSALARGGRLLPSGSAAKVKISPPVPAERVVRVQAVIVDTARG